MWHRFLNIVWGLVGSRKLSGNVFLIHVWAMLPDGAEDGRDGGS